MMTLDEAIKHCEERGCGDTECAAEHRQLAEWLKELKKTRSKTLPKLTDGIGQTRLGFTHEQIQAIERYVRRYVDYALRIQSEPVEWNIDNAKCGDILVYPDGTLAVFNYRLGGLDVGLYMSFLVCSSTGINYKQTCAINNATKATKEQIEVLFNKLRNDISVGWSEEDDDMLYKATAVINRLCAEGKEYIWSVKTLKKLFYWLKSIKDRVQPKQELNENDEKIVTELIGIFESAVDGGHVTFPYRVLKDYIRVLKSCLHQSSWKPSDKQMDAIKDAIDYLGCTKIVRGYLVSLYEDLKKLREK